MILLVDDSEQSLTILTKFLEKSDIHCIVRAKNLRVAFNIFEMNQERISVVLTDIFIPTTDKNFQSGLELIRVIRDFERDFSCEEPVYIIAFSGLDEMESKAIAAGANVFLKKPIKRTQLVDLVKSHI